MIRRSAVTVPLLLVAAALLGGCGDTRKALGFDKSSPDEFKIINRAPLSLPPDYALRPPQPGAVRPQEQAIPARAQAAVTGVAAANPAGLRSNGTAAGSAGENALLAKV